VAEKASRRSVRDAQRRAFNEDRRRLGIPEMGDEDLGTPEVSPTMTYGTGVGGDKAVSVNVQGTVGGELRVTFEAGTTLVSLAERAEQAVKLVGSLTANGPGSTGKSSPDAAAPARPSTGSPFSGY
jgi:hypothetical protein